MSTQEWTAILVVMGSAGIALMGILFNWLKNSFERLSERLDKKFDRLDTKIEASNRENKQDIREIRAQVQGALRCINDTRKSRERCE